MLNKSHFKLAVVYALTIECKKTCSTVRVRDGRIKKKKEVYVKTNSSYVN